MNAPKKRGRPRKPWADDRIIAVIRQHYNFTAGEELLRDMWVTALEKRSLDPLSLHRLIDAISDALKADLSEDQYFAICDAGKKGLRVENVARIFSQAKERRE